DPADTHDIGPTHLESGDAVPAASNLRFDGVSRCPVEHEDSGTFDLHAIRRADGSADARRSHGLRAQRYTWGNREDHHDSSRHGADATSWSVPDASHECLRVRDGEEPGRGRRFAISVRTCGANGTRARVSFGTPEG